MFWGFLTGTFWGLVIGIVGLAVASVVTAPLPGSDREAFETKPEPGETIAIGALDRPATTDEPAQVDTLSEAALAAPTPATTEIAPAPSATATPELESGTLGRPSLAGQAVSDPDAAQTLTPRATIGATSKLPSETVVTVTPGVPGAPAIPQSARPDPNAPDADTQVATLAPRPEPTQVQTAQKPKNLVVGSRANESVVVPSGPAPQVTPRTAQASESVQTPAAVQTTQGVGTSVTAPAPSQNQAVPVTPVLPSPQTARPDTPSAFAPGVSGQIILPSAGGSSDATAPAQSPQPSVQPRVSQGLPGQRVAGLSTDGRTPGFGDRAPTVRVIRPSSATPDTDPNAESETAEAATPEAAEGALAKYAAEFTRETDLPVMSIVLVDNGSLGFVMDALRNFRSPITIAIDAEKRNARDKMRQYRSEGFEVILQANLPEGTRPVDAEIAFEALTTSLPEVIGVLDRDTPALNSDGALRTQVAQILADRGLGFLSTRQGFSAVLNTMERAGVPAAKASRDLGPLTQDVREIRRQLDQAAFTAGQRGEGAVVVLETHPTTMSGLLLWGVSQRAQSVELAPLSYVLQTQN